MFRSRMSAILAIAAVLAIGSAAVTSCYHPGPPTNPPPTTTTTSTSFVPTMGQLTIAPSDGAPGTIVSVQGSNCISQAGHVEVFLATTEAPTTRLVQVVTGAQPPGFPGDWSTALTVPQVVGGSDYLIEAQCWGDGTGFGHPGVQVVYFNYNSSPFTVDPSAATTTTPTTVPQGQLAVAPSDGAAGTIVSVQGSNCVSDAGHIEVFLATTENPSFRLFERDAIAANNPPGNWSVELFTIPGGLVPGSDYEIEAQCWGDGTPFGQPGQQVLYFTYTPQPFTVD